MHEFDNSTVDVMAVQSKVHVMAALHAECTETHERCDWLQLVCSKWAAQGHGNGGVHVGWLYTILTLKLVHIPHEPPFPYSQAATAARCWP